MLVTGRLGQTSDGFFAWLILGAYEFFDQSHSSWLTTESSHSVLHSAKALLSPG